MTIRTDSHTDSDSRTDSTAETAWQEFRSDRDAALARPHGFLSQTALIWLDAEPTEAPGLPGLWWVADDAVHVRDDSGALVLLATGQPLGGDHVIEVAEAASSIELAAGEVRVEVIRRTGRLGLRLLDPRTPRRRDFTGVPVHPWNPELVLTGSWHPHSEPVTIHVDGALPGLEHHLPSPGVVVLEHKGALHELVVTGERSILFADTTSGTGSALWRIVEAQLDGGEVVVDFNRAVNLPAGFSAHATCPRPPRQNTLPFPVTAGEAGVEVSEQ